MVGKIRVKRDEEMVCYKDLGCFRDEGPFDYFDMLPNSPEEVNTKFILHTKQNQKREQFLSYTNASTILNSNFTPKRKTKVIIHGFGSSCHRVWVREMRETFLKMEDVNVICVQWEEGASTPNYVRA
ncbi:Pancreatic lipase-related protein 2, partial [Armadillidium vulgare]